MTFLMLLSVGFYQGQKTRRVRNLQALAQLGGAGRSNPGVWGMSWFPQPIQAHHIGCGTLQTCVCVVPHLPSPFCSPQAGFHPRWAQAPSCWWPQSTGRL